MPKITAKLVAALEPEGADIFVWDTELRGFGVRVYPSGSKKYLLQWKRDGRTRRFLLGSHPVMKTEAARSQALDALARIERGEGPAEERDARKADLSVTELLDLYLKEGAGHLKPGTKEAYASVFRRHVQPLLGDRKLRSLRPADVAKMVDDISNGRTAGKIEGQARKHGRVIVRGGRGIAARSGEYLSAVCAWAVARGMLPTNPCAGVKKPRTRRTERYLSTDEFKRLGSALAEVESEGGNPFIIAAIRLLALTGCRKSEVTNLTWADADSDAGVLRLKDSKTGARVIPLSPPALELLASIPRTEREYVFPSNRRDGSIRNVRKLWSAICERAQISGATLHTLRHSLASTAVMGGASLYLVGKALGHTQAATTERYAHLALDPVRAAVGQAAQHIDDAMRGNVVPLRRERSA